MRKLGMWFLLLTKRLYKKITFILILLLIPTLIFALGIAAQEDSGLIRVALAQEDASDALATEIIHDLASDSRLIYYVKCDTPEAAVSLVKHGKVDSAWVFQENLQEKIDTFARTKSEKDAFVRVVEREETVPLRISHEKLAGTLYRYCSESLYLQFTREEVPQLDSLSDEVMLSYYDGFFVNDNLFEFSYLDSSESTKDALNTGYLLTPIRGLLAIMVMLCGLATSMYFMQDDQRGSFAWIPQHKKSFVEFGYQMISILNVAIVMLLSLRLIGLTTSFLREVLMLLLFSVSCALFCMVLRQICGKIKVLGTLTPLLTVSMIAICPVFFDFKSTRGLQLLFPPTYYINAVHNKKFLLYMVIYCLCTGLIYKLLQMKKGLSVNR